MALVVVPVALACGGIGKQAAGGVVEDASVAVAEFDIGEHRQAALEQLERAWLAALAGQLEYGEASAIRAHVSDALDDGEISRVELEQLEALIPDDTPVDAQQLGVIRAARLGAQEREARRYRWWSLPDDLSRRLEARGWSVTDCDPDEHDDVQCFGTRDSEEIRVYHYTYGDLADARKLWEKDLIRGEVGDRDGDVVISLRVVDEDASVALRDGFFPRRVDLGELRSEAVTKLLESKGWSEVECEPVSKLEGKLSECYGQRGGDLLRVTVYDEPEPDAGWEVPAGHVCLWDRKARFCARVYKPERAREELSSLLSARRG